MKIAARSMALLLAFLMILPSGGLAVNAGKLSPMSAVIFIDDTETALGETLHEWNGWRFVEAYAFAEAFGFPVERDHNPSVTRWDVGVERREIVFTLNHTTDDYIVTGWDGEEWLIDDMESKLILAVSTIPNRDFHVELDNSDFWRLAFWSVYVYSGSRPIGSDEEWWEGGYFSPDLFYPSDLSWFWVDYEGAPDYPDGIEELGLESAFTAAMENIEYFPWSFVIDGQMFIPLELVALTLGFDLSFEDGAINIGTKGTFLDIRLDGSLMAGE